jgi:adenine deaminase
MFKEGNMSPYAELHVHIEGTLEPELTFALAKRNSIELPYADPAELRSHFTYQSVHDFVELYRASAAVLTTEQDFAELTTAYLTKAQSIGIVHAEISCDLARHLARGIAPEAVLNGIGSVLKDSQTSHGVSTGLVLNFPVDLPVDDAVAVYDQAKAAGADITAVEVCVSSPDASPKDLVPLFGRARADGLHTVAHVGAAAGDATTWECLHALKVGRVGTAALTDRNLLYYLADYSIPLTMSPLSTKALHVASEADLPVARLLEEEVAIVVTSDAPAYFGGYLDANMAALVADNGLTEQQAEALARNTIAGSFLPESAKSALIGQPVPA